VGPRLEIAAPAHECGCARDEAVTQQLSPSFNSPRRACNKVHLMRGIIRATDIIKTARTTSCPAQSRQSSHGSHVAPCWRLICSMAHQACRIRALKRDHHDLRQLQDELPGPAQYVCFRSALAIPLFSELAAFHTIDIAI
jgi:hypothetical protein